MIGKRNKKKMEEKETRRKNKKLLGLNKEKQTH